MTKTSLHAFKAKDTRFMADWLKSKGLHKLCSVFEGIQEPFILSLACKSVVYKPCLHTQLPEHNKSYRKVSLGVGAFDHYSLGLISHAEDKPSCIQSERYPIHGGLAEKQRLAQAFFCI